MMRACKKNYKERLKERERALDRSLSTVSTRDLYGVLKRRRDREIEVQVDIYREKLRRNLDGDF